MASEKKLILMSSDNKTFQESEAAALMSETLKNMMIKDDGVAAQAQAIRLRNIHSTTLAKVFEFCNRHTTTDLEALKEFDAKFMAPLNMTTLFDLASAANYMNMKDLRELAGVTISERMKAMTPQQIRCCFNVVVEDDDSRGE